MRSSCYTLAPLLWLVPPWEEQLVFQVVLIQQHFVGMKRFCWLAALIKERDFGWHPSC